MAMNALVSVSVPINRIRRLVNFPLAGAQHNVRNRKGRTNINQLHCHWLKDVFTVPGLEQFIPVFDLTEGF